MYIVYRHLNTRNGKCYVGQTKNGLTKRWKSHIDAALRGSELRFHQALRKHGIECWQSFILEENLSVDDANKSESKWIEFYQSADREKGYNSDKFGRNHDRQWMDDEHKQKIAEATKEFWSSDKGQEKKERLVERNRSEEARKTSSETQKRRWSDPKQKEEMSKRHKGKIVSRESRDLIRKKLKKLWSDPDYRAMMLAKRKTKKTSS